MSLLLKKSKTNQYSKRSHVLIICLGGLYCISCRRLGNYLATNGIQGGHLLRCFIRHVDSFMSIQKEWHILHNFIRVVQNYIHNISENIFLYGTYSTRLGGASSATNVGVPNRLIKAHGH